MPGLMLVPVLLSACGGSRAGDDDGDASTEDAGPGDEDAGTGRSGLPAGEVVGRLFEDDCRTLCEWSVALHGDSVPLECCLPWGTAEDCVTWCMSDTCCQISIDEWEDCQLEMAASAECSDASDVCTPFVNCMFACDWFCS